MKISGHKFSMVETWGYSKTATKTHKTRLKGAFKCKKRKFIKLKGSKKEISCGKVKRHRDIFLVLVLCKYLFFQEIVLDTCVKLSRTNLSEPLGYRLVNK